MILVVILIMCIATLAQHLGLLTAIAKVVTKIASCGMCSTFWSCLAIQVWLGERPDVAVALSIFAAYLSNWFQLLLMWLQKRYNKIWEKIK